MNDTFKTNGKLICQIKKGTLSSYFFLYIFLIVHGAVIWTIVFENIPNKPLFILMLIFAASFIKRVEISKVFFFYSISLVFCYGISAYINDGGFFSGSAVRSALTTSVFAILGYFVYEYDSQNSLSRYVKFMSFIAVITLFFFGIQIIFGPSLFRAPLFIDVGYRDEFGFIIYTICKRDMYRNYGIFYEPGVLKYY